MQPFSLEAKIRQEKNRALDQLRAEGWIPSVVYGAPDEPQVISVPTRAFAKLFAQAGESSLIALTLDGKEVNVLVQDIQRDPLTDEMIHADFRRVDMTKPIVAEVKLQMIGVAPAVKELGGTLVHPKNAVDIRALPSNLVSHLDVDLAFLKTFEDIFRVRDLVLPPGIEVVDDAETVLALVEAPRTEEEMKALDAQVDIDVSKVEVAGKKKEDEEGEVAAEGTPEDKKEEKK